MFSSINYKVICKNIVNTRTFYTFTQNKSLILTEIFDFCNVSVCPMNVFNISCSSFTHLKIAENKSPFSVIFVMFFLFTAIMTILCYRFRNRILTIYRTTASRMFEGKIYNQLDSNKLIGKISSIPY
ncbi:hypothetical protein HZS_1181 [Henneguya salminicola]|nr:hypothetical protein HZS_1181 [Henneguya salminicola]